MKKSAISAIILVFAFYVVWSNHRRLGNNFDSESDLQSEPKKVSDLSQNEKKETKKSNRVGREIENPPETVASQIAGPVTIRDIAESTPNPNLEKAAIKNLKSKTPVSRSFQIVEYTKEEFEKLHPEMANLAKPTASDFVGFEMESKYDEPEVPISQLQSDCGDFKSLTTPVYLRIVGGTVDDAAAFNGSPQSPQAPSWIYGCKFTGGPNAPFTTLVGPSTLEAEPQ